MRVLAALRWCRETKDPNDIWNAPEATAVCRPRREAEPPPRPRYARVPPVCQRLRPDSPRARGRQFGAPHSKAESPSKEGVNHMTMLANFKNLTRRSGSYAASMSEFAAEAPVRQLMEQLQTSDQGLAPDQIERSRETYGANVVEHRNENTPWFRLRKAIVNPFILILALLMILSFATDVKFSDEPDFTKIIILGVMIVWSVIMRFVQESRSADAAAKLLAMIKNTCAVIRQDTGEQEIPFEEVVCGDVVRLAAGDMVPADMRIIEAKDLFVNEASLTGESEPRELACAENASAYMGTTVVSGAGRGIVYLTGNDTMLGRMAKDVAVKPPKTSFEKGIDGVSKVLIGFMAIMVPFVFVINGLTKGDWIGALIFGMSVAVGLTPEMLPTIVTTCLAKGSMVMSKKKVIIKNLDSMQNLGSIDILCTDKTGTLTKDQVELERYLDVMGHDDPRVLRHAFLNSYYQTGLKNLMDKAIIARTEADREHDKSLANLVEHYEKIDEIPFDFERRRMSVMVRDASGKTQMVTKGAVEEMLGCCSYVEYRGEIVALTADMRARVQAAADKLNEEGMRVLAVAQKTDPVPFSGSELSVTDESEMVLIGYLAFLDPPKESAVSAIKALHDHGVAVKVLTGDNDKVAAHICRKVGIRVNRVVLGSEVEQMTDEKLRMVAERENVFAKLSPSQKARLVTVLREAGHTVGFMGDGINDAAALRVADAGISVDTAVDIAKETASVILLEKDLMVLEDGIVEGRRTYANMIKYLKMTASSNFGNMFSVLVASAFLPFVPMASLQLILLDMIYNVTCFAVPWDNVDEEMLLVPEKWDAKSVANFMVWIGPTSSVFDITTYIAMYFLVCPFVFGGPFHTLDPVAQAGFTMLFQTGWCIESMWTQTLVVHMIRTAKIPFVQSHPSKILLFAGIAGIALLTIMPWTPFAPFFDLLPLLPWWYFVILVGYVALYMVLATVMKLAYVKRYGKLL